MDEGEGCAPASHLPRIGHDIPELIPVSVYPITRGKDMDGEGGVITVARTLRNIVVEDKRRRKLCPVLGSAKR